MQLDGLRLDFRLQTCGLKLEHQAGAWVLSLKLSGRKGLSSGVG